MAHILVIDDDEQIRAMLAQMLPRDAHTVTLACDGVEGLRKAVEASPDLILIDMLMPRKDGVETIMALATSGVSIPIVAMSGGRRSVSIEFNLRSAQMVGVKATLAKPFTMAELRLALAQALR
jgi:CheY-like chemotaxis protein